MRYIISLCFFVIAATTAIAQAPALSNYQKYFEKDLKPWVKSVPGFKLSDFSFKEKIAFENDGQEDLSGYKELEDPYKPLMSYSPDSSRFVDIYSYQLNLVKKKNYYQANIGLEQAIYFYDKPKKYSQRIYFLGFGQWIDEVVWVSDTRFLMPGIQKTDDNKSQPRIIIGDINDRVFYIYTIKNNIVFQNHNYRSPKFKRMKIRGL